MRSFLALLLLVPACGGGGDGPGRAAELPPRAVRLEPAALVPMATELPVTGLLQAQDELVLGFQVGGRLAELRVDVGDVVRAGELVASLDRRDFELEIARASAAQAQAQARLGLPAENGGTPPDPEATATVREAQAVLAEAVLARDRTRKLVQQQLRPQSELDAAEATYAVAQSRLQRARDEVQTWRAELQQARVELEVARKRYSDAAIAAPWDGRVAARTATAGQYVAAGTPVLTLLRVHPLRLRMQVPERAASQVAVGQEARFLVDGEGAQEFTGKVTRILPEILRETRVLMVEAEVPNEDGRLRPGGFARARLVVDPDAQVVAVPRQAVVSFAGVDRVFTVRDGKAVELLLELGRRQGELVEVRTGLPAGTLVVQAPGSLFQGAAVTVQE